MYTRGILEKRICHLCIRDPYLSAQVRDNCAAESCSYCSRTYPAITLGDMARRIERVVEEHFELTPPYPCTTDESLAASQGEWERRGETAGWVIAKVTRLEKEALRDLTSLLEELHSSDAFFVGQENEYGRDAGYEEREADDADFRHPWEEFCEEIRAQSRFFSTKAEKALTYIFGDLHTQRTFGDTPVIREIGPNDENRFVWRGRKADSDQALEAILASPTRELGPPPPTSAQAGRMNAQGVSVFYGALEKRLCVAELRPAVGSYVVLGRFELLHTVKILDLGALEDVYVNASYFDPEYSEHKSRAAFLKRLVSEVARPVIPGNEGLEYLPTQAAAEFLAYKSNPPFDGLIYPSSQVARGGQNLVLFNRVRGVEYHELPEGMKIEVQLPADWLDGLDSEENQCDGIVVIEKVPLNLLEEGSPIGSEETKTDPTDNSIKSGTPKHDARRTPPTLQLDQASVEVLKIKGVDYATDTRQVSRQKGNMDETQRP